MATLYAHSESWGILYNNEAVRLKAVFGPHLLDIQHIGSTAVSDLLAKPIVDIAVRISSHKEADQFILPLQELGYTYRPELSSVERHFFKKEIQYSSTSL